MPGPVYRLIHGKASETKHDTAGFTLLELMLVLALLSIMLYLVLPNFSALTGQGEGNDISRWIIVKVQMLKERASQQQKEFIMHISPGDGILWITDGEADEEAVLAARESGFEFPEGFSIIDVEFPNAEKTSADRAEIRFYKGGYSDKALIHVEDDDNNEITFLIEPFLTNVKQYNKHAGFDD
ncbi:prepilin-type N-terminal cleavage/methylation domain-containing protein [Desulfobacterales bacterium HSG16]|nr:prepilin-type N-terminal cleavage/methylation domain-containing protein [Desulfobacterales bacterium HSG16]